MMLQETKMTLSLCSSLGLYIPEESAVAGEVCSGKAFWVPGIKHLYEMIDQQS